MHRLAGENNDSDELCPAIQWVLRHLDSILVPIGASLYSLAVCLVWARMAWHSLETISGYCTLILALVVLINIFLLSRKHQERELDLEIQRKCREEWRKLYPEPAKFPPQKGKWVGWMQVVVPVTILYLVSVLGFSHLIYPFIAVDKAGGNYSTIDPVSIVFNNKSGVCRSEQLPKTILPTRNYYVIEETADWLYLAKSDDGFGPDCWKWGIFCYPDVKDRGSAAGEAGATIRVMAKKTHVPSFRPEVYQVNRQCIASIDPAL